MTHYETLRITHSCTIQEITNAYRKGALANHPDRGGDEAVMKAINVAYSVLRHPARRAAYDAELMMHMPATKERTSHRWTSQPKGRKLSSNDRKLIMFYAFTIPAVLMVLFDVWCIGLDVVGAASGARSLWFLAPGLLAAVLISRNIRGLVFRYVAV